MYWLLFKYQRNFAVPLDQETIYKRSLTWLRAPAGTLTKEDVFSDPANFRLNAKLKVKIDATEYVLHNEFKFAIECFNQKYRITIEDFTFSYYDTSALKTIKFKMESEDEWNLIKPYIEKIAENLYKYISLKTKA